MKRALAATVMALALAGNAGQAAAQPDRPFQLDLTGAFRGGSNGTVGEARLFAGYAHHFPSGPRRSLFLAAGFEGTLGKVYFDDLRGVDGRLSARRRTYGPALRAGFAWSASSWPKLYTFASAAAIVADTRTDSRMLVESGRAAGGRLAIGLAAPGSFEAALEHDRGNEVYLGLLMLVAPNTIEVSYEELHAGGDAVRRVGIGFGYAL